MNADGIIDLRSDTYSSPQAAMNQYALHAKVGNSHEKEDGSENVLLEYAADLLGKPAAIFLPSGTMCNVIAFRVHCQPGDEVILDSLYHPLHFEGGGYAAVANLVVKKATSARGIFTAHDVEELISPRLHYFSQSRLICIEQTCNLGGGKVWSIADLTNITSVAKKYNLKVHMDGARLFNACVACGVSPAQYGQQVDSIWISLTKGLAAPVGSILAGSVDFIEQARFCQMQLGGIMRKPGMLAAAGLYVLKNHINRLSDDHSHARLFATLLAESNAIAINIDEVETNIIHFKLRDTKITVANLCNQLKKKNIYLLPIKNEVIRAVTHIDITSNDIEYSVKAIKEMLAC